MRHLWAILIVLPFLSGCQTQESTSQTAAPTSLQKPNIIVILTDQERYPAHWPAGWAEKNLAANNRLRQHGLAFTRAYTSACECTPSRAVLYSGEHFPANQVATTPPTGAGLPSDKELADIGSLLKNLGGYDVVWKGKWHLTPPLKGGHDWTKEDIANLRERYDVSGWNPPDAGTAITEHVKNPNGTIFDGLTTLGGGFANNDGRFLEGASKRNPKQVAGFGESILEYIQKVADTPAGERKPFCLFVSFVNPHDVWVYPGHYEKAGYKRDDFANMGISLPDNYTDSLTTKPSVQLKVRDAYQKISPINDSAEAVDYVNFYAYLNKLVDGHVGTLLDALDKAGLTDSTVIFRTADHGELGLSHGMREKAYTAYEEMIHVPMIVSNPKLFPTPKTTDAFVCHLDLLPTIAELAGVPNYGKYGKGVSIVPVINDPAASVQDAVLFAFDDQFFLPNDVPAGHIRAIREGDWTYAVYYSNDGSSFEYEMYNLKDDPGQMNNLLFKDVSPQIAKEADRLHGKLKKLMDESGATPAGFSWLAKSH